MKRIFVISLFAALMMTGFGNPSLAFEKANPATKLGRGVVNFFTSPLEIFLHQAGREEDHDEVTAFSVGLVEGVFATFRRAAVGLYDVVTFPFPGTSDYEPIMDPPTVFEGMPAKY